MIFAGLSGRDDRSLPRSPRLRLRALRRCADADPLRQHHAGRGHDPRRRRAEEALGSVALFAGRSPEEIHILSSLAVPKRVAAGELLFSEGKACKGLYVIAFGKLRNFKSSASGREQVLSVEGPGGSVAELPVFDGAPYPASVSAVEDSQILFISHEDLRRFCPEGPEVAPKMLAIMGARLRRLVGI